MISQLTDIKSDLFEMLQSSINPDSTPINLNQILDYKLPAAQKNKVVIIQNQQVQININSNIINLIKKVDSIINELTSSNNTQKILYTFFNNLLENGLTLNEIINTLKMEYIKIAEEKEGSCAAVAKKLGINRTTLVELKKRENRYE